MNDPKVNFVQELLDQYPSWFTDAGRMDLAQMTDKNYPYTSLFAPIQVNRLTLKNRIVMGPMGNIDMAEEMGRPSNKMIQYFADRARGGTGLLTSGLIPISQAVDPTVTERGNKTYFPRIDSSRTVYSGWRDLAETVHAYGARFLHPVDCRPGARRLPRIAADQVQIPGLGFVEPQLLHPGHPLPGHDRRGMPHDHQGRRPGCRGRQGRADRRGLSARSRRLPAGANDQPRFQPPQTGAFRQLAELWPRHGQRNPQACWPQLPDHVSHRSLAGP